MDDATVGQKKGRSAYNDLIRNVLSGWRQIENTNVAISRDDFFVGLASPFVQRRASGNGLGWWIVIFFWENLIISKVEVILRKRQYLLCTKVVLVYSLLDSFKVVERLF